MNTKRGIHLETSSSFNFVKNNIILNNDDGIVLATNTPTNNTVENNIISWNNNYGIILSNSRDTNLTGNIIEFNANEGIYVAWSYECVISGNTVANNIDYGIYVVDSSNNWIFHNNFINNTNQAYDFKVLENQWDNSYPSGGNYWSDYTGNDSLKGPFQNIPGSDGIGDTNHSIDIDTIDKYPLMEPYTGKPFENYTILQQGWNLISIPLIQDYQDITKVLEMIDGWYDAVQWYNTTDACDPWKHNRVGKSFGNDLFKLNESIGFWIHITNSGDTIFLYNGTQPTVNQSITLHQGWNMVGYPSLINRTRDNTLNNINYGSDVDAIWTFDANTQAWQEIGPSDYFELGKGYWIHSKGTEVWDVPL
jgi:parallel beta-helix repeat protein